MEEPLEFIQSKQIPGLSISRQRLHYGPPPSWVGLPKPEAPPKKNGFWNWLRSIF